MVKSFMIVASWECWTCGGRKRVLGVRNVSNRKIGAQRITMSQVEGVVEKTLVKESLDRNIGTITLDNPSKHNARHEGGI